MSKYKIGDVIMDLDFPDYGKAVIDSIITEDGETFVSYTFEIDPFGEGSHALVTHEDDTSIIPIKLWNSPVMKALRELL